MYGFFEGRADGRKLARDRTHQLLEGATGPEPIDPRDRPANTSLLSAQRSIMSPDASTISAMQHEDDATVNGAQENASLLHLDADMMLLVVTFLHDVVTY
jgi:hypothetical protein